MSRKIFISYCRKDKDVVYGIVRDIENATGEECWIDTNIESGDLFESVIIKSIERADVVIFMMSKAAIASETDCMSWTVREIWYALKKGKQVIPVSIDGTKTSDCAWTDFNLSPYNCVDYRDEIQREKFLHDMQCWVDGGRVL